MGRLRWTRPDVAPQPVTPGEIDAALFTQVRNRWAGTYGYAELEVDEFLDRCADTIARQRREIDALGARLAQVSPALPSPPLIRDTEGRYEIEWPEDTHPDWFAMSPEMLVALVAAINAGRALRETGRDAAGRFVRAS